MKPLLSFYILVSAKKESAGMLKSLNAIGIDWIFHTYSTILINFFPKILLFFGGEVVTVCDTGLDSQAGLRI